MDGEETGRVNSFSKKLGCEGRDQRMGVWRRGKSPIKVLFICLSSTGRTWGCLKRGGAGTSLAVQWLRICTSTAGSRGSIPGWGTRIPHAMCRGQKKKNAEGGVESMSKKG